LILLLQLITLKQLVQLIELRTFIELFIYEDPKTLVELVTFYEESTS
jgi:hypothetical protein